MSEQHDETGFIDHKWSPVQGWQGRYRCSDCGILGYRGMATYDRESKPNEQAAWQAATPKRCATIFPYICKAKECKSPALGYGRYQFCRAHGGGHPPSPKPRPIPDLE